jgi:UDP-2,4-diacetamido-2,4,6-trideoxy-beta-L-altropyranose hydrolase
MRVAFRVDASTEIGTGHVTRCLTLALALRDAGVESLFLSRDLAGNLNARVRDAGFELVELPPPVRAGADTSAGPPHAAWLRVDWREDAAQTRDALTSLARADWLVTDHYALDARWERALAAVAPRRMIIDDLGDRDHDCELLLDQNIAADLQTRYRQRVPAHCVQLLGPSFALLQPVYSALRAGVVARTAPVKRILVYFGGADIHGMTAKAVAACGRLGRSGIAVDVVMSSKSAAVDAVRREIEVRANTRLHLDLPSLAPLIAAADLAVGASGVTVWERLCLGLPSVIVSVAENQRGVSGALQREGLARWAGHYDELGSDKLFEAVRTAVDDPSLERWSKNCLLACDGRGTERVVAALTQPLANGTSVAAAKVSR